MKNKDGKRQPLIYTCIECNRPLPRASMATLSALPHGRGVCYDCVIKLQQEDKGFRNYWMREITPEQNGVSGGTTE